MLIPAAILALVLRLGASICAIQKGTRFLIAHFLVFS